MLICLKSTNQNEKNNACEQNNYLIFFYTILIFNNNSCELFNWNNILDLEMTLLTNNLKKTKL